MTPSFRFSTFFSSTSTHTTSCPASASTAACTNPTYPIPNTVTFILFLLLVSHLLSPATVRTYNEVFITRLNDLRTGSIHLFMGPDSRNLRRVLLGDGCY